MRGIVLHRPFRPKTNAVEALTEAFDEAAQEPVPDSATTSGTEAQDVPEGALAWQSVALPRNYVRNRTMFRAAIAVPLVVLAAIGVKTVVFPAQGPVAAATATIPDVVNADTAAAASTAEYVARSWLTLDDPGAREGRLSGAWADPRDAGWNKQGSLSTGNSYVVAVDRLTANTMDVTVAVSVFLDPNNKDAASGWVGVLVPIQTSNGTASVRAVPRIVGLPDPAPFPAVKTLIEDPRMSSETRSDAERFFTAWAEGDASGVSAPGADIPAPPALGKVTLTSWSVGEGSEDTRQATADITWQVGAVTLRSSYNLTLTKVSAADGNAARWQVSDIH